jgi:hypothetical protein
MTAVMALQLRKFIIHHLSLNMLHVGSDEKGLMVQTSSALTYKSLLCSEAFYTLL